MDNRGLLANLKASQPSLWKLLLEANKEGLIIIDEENDGLTATNRLLWTYPGLHEVLIRIINGSTEDMVTNFDLKDFVNKERS